MLKERFMSILDILRPFRAQINRLKGFFPEVLMDQVGVHDMSNLENLSYFLGDLSRSQGRDQMALNWSLRSWSEPKRLNIGPARSTLKHLTIHGCAIDIMSVVDQKQLTHLDLMFQGWSDSDVCAEIAVVLLASLPALKEVSLHLFPKAVAMQDRTMALYSAYHEIIGRIDLPNLIPGIVL